MIVLQERPPKIYEGSVLNYGEPIAIITVAILSSFLVMIPHAEVLRGSRYNGPSNETVELLCSSSS